MPQLRTRLSRLERLAGLFAMLATLLMLLGLGYYIYQRAEQRGWLLRKLPYFTFVENAAGLNVGDKVKMMGFDVGEILEIEAQPPEDTYYNVYVRFRVWEPYYGYLWDDSVARVAAADLLGRRFIEVTKGTQGAPTYLFHEVKDVPLPEAMRLTGEPEVVFGQELFEGSRLLTRVGEPLSRERLEQIAALGSNVVQVIFRADVKKAPTVMWDYKAGRYERYQHDTKGFFLEPDESPALTERLEKLVNIVETNLPHVLDLTNQLADAFSHTANAARNAEELLSQARPAATNLTAITSNLLAPRGALGEWLLPTNVHQELLGALASARATLRSANTALTNTDERLGLLATNLNLSLENLAGITSNLNAQVQANSNLVGSLNRIITNSDAFIQGLRRHWLFRSAFKEDKPHAPPPRRLTSPRETP